MRREQTDNKNEASAEPDEDPPAVTGETKMQPTSKVVTSSPKSEQPAVVRRLTPPSKKMVPTQKIQPKIIKESASRNPPIAAPRSPPAKYQPARLASPPSQPARRDSWIQTVKRYN